MNKKFPSELIYEFFVEIRNSQNIYLKKALEGDFTEVGKFSPFAQRFLDDDETLFLSILPEFIFLLENDDCAEEIVEIERRKLINEIEKHYINLDSVLVDQAREIIRIEIKEARLKNISLETLEVNSNEIFHNVLLPMIKEISQDQTSRNYFYAYLLEMVYDRFSHDSDKEERFNKTPVKENLIYQYYKSVEIDIAKNDPQFIKYDLYTVSEYCEILVALPSRIIDNKNKIQLMIDMQEQLLQMLVNLKKGGEILDLAFLAKSQSPIRSDQRISILLGTYQTPLPPKIQNMFNDVFDYVLQDTIKCKLVSDDKLFYSDVIYKFHEEKIGDAIWVFSSGNSVEFEEILEDVEILDDCVVTRLVHLEYVEHDKRTKISHIDHEYLFYSYDEFEQRAENYNQRAGAKKRIKTFKVDNSKIPLVLEDGTFTLYTILDAYFSKAYLLQDFLVKGCGLLDVQEMVKQRYAK